MRETTHVPEQLSETLRTSYARPVAEIAAALGVDPVVGHPEAGIAQLHERFGRNVLPQATPRSRLLLFLEQFNNPLIYILLAAAILTVVVSDWADAVTIFVVVIFNAAIGYFQEQRAAERLKAVKDLTAPTAKVIRDGAPTSIPAEDLAVGDVVLLESGVRVPADLRLLETSDLTVDESMLTGESLPAVKRAESTHSIGTMLADRANMVYSATTIRRGRGKGLVVGLGAGSEVGRISQSIAEAESTTSPLQERLERFGKLLGFAIGVAVALIFAVGLLRGYPPTTMLLTAIGLAVSAIPEGLPIAVTVALSIGVYRLARNKAVVRKLNAVETLGSTTIICSDKTGTLTRNQMTVVAIATDDRIYHVTGGGYAAEGTILDDVDNQIRPDAESPLAWTLRVGLFCTESSFSERGGERQLVGDPTEGALIVAAEKSGSVDSERERWRPQILLPFESERMYMATRINAGDEEYVLVKGSAEKLAAMCTRELRSEGLRELDTTWIRERQGQLSERGYRVIAAAYFPVAPGEAVDPLALGGGIFAGLFGIEDPPRPEVAQAIADAQRAGIKVSMVTGDHVKTAVAIADALNIKHGRRVRSVEGAELEALDDEDLFERVNGTDVYARVAPEHKLRIVRQLQAHRHVVAMTGDGVNDGPALKQADIGIAMGTGTDVAREASALVVQDDNFATIVKAIRYGRVMYRNLQHMILYVLCTSAGGVLTLTAAVLLGFPLPVLAVQLLWVNLVTDGTSTIPLAYEREHGNIMSEQPRSRSEGLVSWQMGERIVTTALVMMFGTLIAFELVLMQQGHTAFEPDIPSDVMTLARTVAFTTLALLQIWNVHNSRSLDRSIFSIGLLSNKPLLYVTMLAIALQVAAVELPFMHPLLRTTDMTLNEWLLCLGISLSLVVLVELRKLGGRIYGRREVRGEE